MLTQMELQSASSNGLLDGDSSALMSPLDSFIEYPMEQTELEYFESQFESNLVSAGDSLNDFIQSQQEVLESLPTPPTPSEDPPPYQLSLYDSSDSIDATSLIYDSDELKPFAKDFSSFNGLTSLGSFDTSSAVGLDAVLDNRTSTTATFDLEGGIKYEFDIKYEVDSPGMYSPPASDVESPRSNNPFDCSSSDIPAALRIKPEESEIISLLKAPPGVVYKDTLGSVGGNGKGKISALQRRALDNIFAVTERPSRGLVLHIAQELGLHHLTVKNFFSNGRRRLRRAAARVQDPERTQRENQRRKEKRRLAAIAAAVNNNNNNNNIERCTVSSSIGMRSIVSSTSQDNAMDVNTQKEPPQISPQRRALMEKLADKVQRSVAQRSLQGDIPDLGQTNLQLVTTTTTPLDISSAQLNLMSKHIDLSQLSSASLDALAPHLDFDTSHLDVSHLDATHLDLQAHLELHQPSSLDLQDLPGTSIDLPVSGVDIPVSIADIPVSGVDLVAVSGLDLNQQTTTALLQIPQDPDPWAFF
ncbi:unnamed protein product [Meganyctiphanes norvegica]|uniref:Homeobox domain-containing protein n=1 Tax=Meganyctiphanes norvegica TaxID=48144 RepID=A0AAV2QE16_MEGNR